MQKHIVLFSDGTGNSASSLFKTNVRRMYEALDLTDPQDPLHPRQFAFYDDGVGTSTFRPLALLGGAMGVGLARNVRDLYEFLCRTYCPGDRIYAFGFSRGAFTIRVLIGLIMEQGLVRYNGNEADLTRDALLAYRAYRRNRERPWQISRPFRAVRDLLTNAKAYESVERIGGPDSDDPIRIEFLGLWDTVDAYGLPIDELTRAVDRFIVRLTMRDLMLNPRVLHARHALALDDERNTFHPRLWTEATEPGANTATTHIDQERISQVWFAGVHANVGGGYPDDSLAHVSLKWMMGEADKHRLRFKQAIRDKLLALEDESGPIYDSRSGLAGYYRYKPRRIEFLTNTSLVNVPRTKIHESVFRRMQIGQDGYAPPVLPPGFAVVRLDGSIVPGDVYLNDLPAPPVPPDTIDRGSAFDTEREHVWNWVWWRRVVYFATLGATLFLAVMPLFLAGAKEGACMSRLCFLSSPISSLSVVLPAFAETWTESFATHPEYFLPSAALIALGLWLGRVLELRVRDDMRRIWYRMAKLRPATEPPIPAPAAPSGANLLVERLRQASWYGAAFRVWSQHVMPAAFLLVLAYGAYALIGQISFAVRDSAGYVCAGSASLRPVYGPTETAEPFRTREVCAGTGLALEKGATYRIRFTIPAEDAWTDRGIPAGPNGIRMEAEPMYVKAWMALAVPLRRHLGHPWFMPMARIGSLGNDEYPLVPKPSLAPGAAPQGDRRASIDTCKAPETSPRFTTPAAVTFETELVARTTGELFLYVNDAVPPFTSGMLYCNNTGAATVSVERRATPGP